MVTRSRLHTHENRRQNATHNFIDSLQAISMTRHDTHNDRPSKWKQSEKLFDSVCCNWWKSLHRTQNENKKATNERKEKKNNNDNKFVWIYSFLMTNKLHPISIKTMRIPSEYCEWIEVGLGLVFLSYTYNTFLSLVHRNGFIFQVVLVHSQA